MQNLVGGAQVSGTRSRRRLNAPCCWRRSWRRWRWRLTAWGGGETERGIHTVSTSHTGNQLQTKGAPPTLRVLLGVAVARKRRLAGVWMAVPYSMSSSVCLLFFSCCFGEENRVSGGTLQTPTSCGCLAQWHLFTIHCGFMITSTALFWSAKLSLN